MTALLRSAGVHPRMPITVVYTGVLTVLLASCGPTKTAQCNSLIAIVNKVGNETMAMSKSTNPNKMAELTKMAGNFEQYAQEMAAVKLEDQALQGFQARFVGMYQETSKASKDLLGAIAKRDARLVGSSIKALRAASGKESSLVTEMNQYCHSRQS